jgi:hypothetical protein
MDPGRLVVLATSFIVLIEMTGVNLVKLAE